MNKQEFQAIRCRINLNSTYTVKQSDTNLNINRLFNVINNRLINKNARIYSVIERLEFEFKIVSQNYTLILIIWKKQKALEIPSVIRGVNLEDTYFPKDFEFRFDRH